MGKNLDKFAKKHRINTVHAEKEALKTSKEGKELKQDDINELVKKIAKDLGYLK